MIQSLFVQLVKSVLRQQMCSRSWKVLVLVSLCEEPLCTIILFFDYFQTLPFHTNIVSKTTLKFKPNNRYEWLANLIKICYIYIHFFN